MVELKKAWVSWIAHNQRLLIWLLEQPGFWGNSLTETVDSVSSKRGYGSMPISQMMIFARSKTNDAGVPQSLIGTVSHFVCLYNINELLAISDNPHSTELYVLCRPCLFLKKC